MTRGVRFGLLAAEILLLFFTAFFFSRFRYVAFAFRALSVILCIFVLNAEMNDSYKTLYVFLLCVFPLFGSVVYFIMRLGKSVSEKRRKKRRKDGSKTGNYLAAEFGAEALPAEDIRYYSCGKEFFDALTGDIEKAKKFVLLQFYIVKSGSLQKKVFKALQAASERGVKVFLLYDGFGSAAFEKEIKKFGEENDVKCRCFNKVGFLLNGGANNRNHSKSAVIDGVKGYVGGVNIGDEYVGEDMRYGIWKDGGMSYRGKAVNALTSAFFRLYNLRFRQKERAERYFGDVKAGTEGIPLRTFVSEPTSGKSRQAEVYKTLIYNAKKSVSVCTPYLILDDGVFSALTAAAARGVEVAVVIPSIPDKKIVYAVTLSFAQRLKKQGVKIYLYKKGFLHAKNTVIDGKYVICGSANLDYRSMYLHYETGIFFKNARIAGITERDLFSDTVEYEGKTKGIVGKFLKAFSPLM